MIYLVTTEKNLFESPNYKVITVQESLDIMDSWECIEFDSETSGERNLDFLIYNICLCVKMFVSLYKKRYEKRR